jgi:hypothetical protein
VVAAGRQQLPVQALQAAEKDQHPQQEQAKDQQQANRVGEVDHQDRRKPGPIDPEGGERQPPDLTQAQAQVLGEGGQRQGPPAQPIKAQQQGQVHRAGIDVTKVMIHSHPVKVAILR